VSFDASASSDPDGDPITKYVWSFGDGSTETTSNPTNTHVYGAAGSFAVSLTVQDAQSNSSAAVKHTIKIVADKPTARFTAQRSKPTVGETVKFDGSASSDADGDAITSYQWSFGDGSTLTTSTPSTTHAYGSV